MNMQDSSEQARVLALHFRIFFPMSLKKSVIAAWSSFDFTHTAFSMIMITFVYPLYFANEIVTNGNGDLYWSISMSASMLIVALLGPALGAITDETRSK